MSRPILHTRKLCIGYTGKRQNTVIAENVDIALAPGKLIALIGANGVGKSTLLRTLTRIQRPLSGEIRLHEDSIESYSAPELAQGFSVVLTEKLPPSNLTVAELVALGRQPYTNWIGQLTHADTRHIRDAMALTGVSDLAAKKHYALSDGQLQKVLIARALAQDTPLIILDEPTTHLDLLHKVSLLRLLKKLARAGKCILFSTHDIDLALELSDELIVMTAGKTVQGAPSALIANGVFNALFDDEHIAFDVEKAKFIFKNL